MLFAHYVPGYFAAVCTQPYWNPEWSSVQRGLLWAAAVGSTIALDTDVIYNAVFRGFLNHSTLYTHSLFVHLSIAAVWGILYFSRRWDYLTMLIGLITFGGLSHLLLDVIAHNTPLFYPFSTRMIGIAPQRVTSGRILHYVTHPVFFVGTLTDAVECGALGVAAQVGMAAVYHRRDDRQLADFYDELSAAAAEAASQS